MAPQRSVDRDTGMHRISTTTRWLAGLGVGLVGALSVFFAGRAPAGSGATPASAATTPTTAPATVPATTPATTAVGSTATVPTLPPRTAPPVTYPPTRHTTTRGS